MEKYRGVSIGTDKPVYGFYYNIEDKEHYILQKARFGLYHCEVYIASFIGDTALSIFTDF